MNRMEQDAARVLRIQELLHFVNLDIVRHPGESESDQMRHDKHIATYEKVLWIVEALYIDRPASRVFTLDIGLTAPLYDVACRCRDPCVRRRALHVLKTRARQEGIYESTLAVKIAETVVSMEEEGLGGVQTAADIPNSARVFQVSRSFDLGARTATLGFYRPDPLGVEPRCDYYTVDF